MARRVNCDSVTYVKLQHGLWTKGQNSAVDAYGLKVKGATHEPNPEFPIVECIGQKLKQPKEWSDIKGEVVTDYQAECDHKFVDELRKRYSVVIYPEVMATVNKH